MNHVTTQAGNVQQNQNSARLMKIEGDLAMIREAIQAQTKILEQLAAAIKSAPAPTQPAQQAQGPGGVASDYEMSGEYGNPVVKKDPPRWAGSSYAGRRMNECPADYLESLAGFFDWQGTKRLESSGTYTNNKGETVHERDTAKYAFKDARLARGWAARAKAAPQPAANAFVDDSAGDSEIPF